MVILRHHDHVESRCAQNALGITCAFIVLLVSGISLSHGGDCPTTINVGFRIQFADGYATSRRYEAKEYLFRLTDGKT